MLVVCFHCDGLGFVGTATPLACEPCNATGRRWLEPTAPFSIEALLGDDETEPNLAVRCIAQDIPSREQAETRLRSCSELASDEFDGWTFFVSDANGVRLKKAYRRPTATV